MSFFPVSVFSVKAILSISGWRGKAAPAEGPKPTDDVRNTSWEANLLDELGQVQSRKGESFLTSSKQSYNRMPKLVPTLTLL